MAATEFTGRPVRIATEAAAWATLEAVLERGASRRRGQIAVSDWSNVSLTYWVKGGDSVITPPIMRGLLAMQESILRTRFIAIENTSDLRGVGAVERSRYEMKARIYPGSSGIEIDLTEITKHLITELTDHMPPEYVLGLGAFAILAWSGQSVWRKWLDNRKDIALSEIEAGKNREVLSALKFSNETDLERWKIFNEAQQRFPGASEIEKAVEKGRLALVEAASFTEKAKIANRIIEPSVAKDLSSQPLAEEERDDISGLFRILYVDPTARDGFKIRLEHIETGEKLSAFAQDAMLSERDKSLIQQGEWQKKPIEASVRVKRRGQAITNATVTAVLRVATEYV